MEIINRKAKFDYFVNSEIECGIVLKGTEIKSVRKGSVDLKDTYARIKNDEEWCEYGSESRRSIASVWR